MPVTFSAFSPDIFPPSAPPRRTKVAKRWRVTFPRPTRRQPQERAKGSGVKLLIDREAHSSRAWTRCTAGKASVADPCERGLYVQGMQGGAVTRVQCL